MEAFYYIEGVGPHRFQGIDKYGQPFQAAMTHRITITEMKGVVTELDKPKNVRRKGRWSYNTKWKKSMKSKAANVTAALGQQLEEAQAKK